MIDLSKGLSVEQLDKLIGKRDYRGFLNSRNQLYREMKMKEKTKNRDGSFMCMPLPDRMHNRIMSLNVLQSSIMIVS